MSVRVPRLVLPMPLLFLAACAVIVLFRPAAASALASHVGWPPREPGMLLMNKTDAARPLDARPGLDPFGGLDPQYRCDAVRLNSDSCLLRLVPLLATAVSADVAAASLVVTDAEGHNRLLGGHGNDTIHAAPWGDVLWGDYKPTEQTRHQTDHLYGGPGPDFIYPSHGKNVVKAGAGSDVIHARFGHGTIDCGPGRDAVYLPAVDGAYKLKNCEFKRKRTGESAPQWLLAKLPW